MNTNIKSISIIGLGWLGFELGKFLLGRGIKVKGSTTTPEKISKILAAGMLGEVLALTQNTGLDSALGQRLLDTDLIFINLPPRRKQEGIEEVYPAQVEQIVDAAEKLGKKKYILVSSTGVYGDQAGILDENDIPVPAKGSGRALMTVETRLGQRLGARLTIIRPGGLVGGARVAGRFFAGRKDIPNGNAPVNMIHRKDVIGIIDAIITQNKWGEIYNLVATTHPSKSEFYIHQARKHGFEEPSFLTNNPRDVFKLVSNAKVLEDLNYQFVYPDVMDF